MKNLTKQFKLKGDNLFIVCDKILIQFFVLLDRIY
jgi:hypothetical protein